MSCDRRCFGDDWEYGEIDCSECPGRDTNATREQLEESQRLLDEGLKSRRNQMDREISIDFGEEGISSEALNKLLESASKTIAEKATNKSLGGKDAI